MKPARGMLQVKATYYDSDEGAKPVSTFSVRCARCKKALTGNGAKTTARAKVIAAGWRHDRRFMGWQCANCAAPTIRYLGKNGVHERFRIEGGALRADWSRSHTKHIERQQAADRPVSIEPWCEVSVDIDGGVIGSFGGTVWPAAWADLFIVKRDGPFSASYTKIRPFGAATFRKAIEHFNNTMTKANR